jgi:hypothetical protein
MSLDLRPLTLGELLDRSFGLFRRHFWLFVGLMAVPSVITLLLGVVMLLVPELVKMPTFTGSDPDPAALAAIVIAGALGFIVFLIAYWVAYMITLGATTVAVSELYVGRSATIASAYSHVRSLVGRLIVLMLIIGLRLMGIFLGIVAIVAVLTVSATLLLGPFAVVLAFLGTMAAAFACLLYALRYAVAVPVLVLEHATPTDAIRRSIDLTRDNLGRTAVLVIFAMIITYAALALFQGPFTVGAIVAGPETSTALWLNLAGTFTGAVGGAVSGPLMIIALALLYYDLRIRKEGLDLELMMANLDSDAAPPGPPRPLPTAG